MALIAKRKPFRSQPEPAKRTAISSAASAMHLDPAHRVVPDRAVAEGLLVQAGTNDKGLPLYEATWTLRTSIVRQQTFPPGTPVAQKRFFQTENVVMFKVEVAKKI